MISNSFIEKVSLRYSDYSFIYFTKPTKDLKLTLEHFWATPRIPDRLMGDDDIYFAWYLSGCSNNHNGDSIEITMNGETDTIDLSTPGKAFVKISKLFYIIFLARQNSNALIVFKFKDYEEVYFHAQVRACKDLNCVRHIEI